MPCILTTEPTEYVFIILWVTSSCKGGLTIQAPTYNHSTVLSEEHRRRILHSYCAFTLSKAQS